MKNNKILVLLDLNDQSLNVLKSATRMAQIIGAEVEIFHVHKPTRVVKIESNLSAVGEIKDHFVEVENELKNMVNTILQNSDVKINHIHVFGNIKNEIESHINKTNPDVIVVGKKASRTPSFIGDNMLSFLLKKFQGTMMVADHENVLNAQSKLKLGLFNSKNIDSKNHFMEALISNSESPISTYEIANREGKINNVNEQDGQKIVSYVFEDNDQAMQTISNYLGKNKVNLILINRKLKTANKGQEISISKLNDLVQTLRVPVLLSND